MKISLNWVKQYVDLDGLTTKDVVDALTMSGLEVGDVVDQTARYDKFVVADVVEKVKHPNADRLALCKVNDGAETLDVVCGAPNVEAGQKVAFAQVGSKLPRGGHKITKAKIRGVVSNGMICAEDELDIGDDHSGIIVLDPKLKTGTPLADALGLNDVLLEIETTPNRSDALSHYGVARDLSALFDRKLTKPTIALEEGKTSAKKLAEIAVLDPEHCPRYTATVVRGVEIKDSPDWLKNRLISIGARPINNVVGCDELRVARNRSTASRVRSRSPRGQEDRRAETEARGENVRDARLAGAEARRRGADDLRRRATRRRRGRDGRREQRGDARDDERADRERVLQSAKRAPHGAKKWR